MLFVVACRFERYWLLGLGNKLRRSNSVVHCSSFPNHAHRMILHIEMLSSNRMIESYRNETYWTQRPILTQQCLPRADSLLTSWTIFLPSQTFGVYTVDVYLTMPVRKSGGMQTVNLKYSTTILIRSREVYM